MLRIFGDPHSENGTITWQPEPLSRGTWSILSTCTLTMFLCVWTAVHLNVPPPESTVRAFLRKTRWLILGLFAPELVVFTAWSQYKAARWTANSLNKSKNNTREPTEHSTPLEKKTSWAFWRNKSQGRSSEQPKWTTVHGFYINMGGIAIDPRAWHQFLPDKENTLMYLNEESVKAAAQICPSLLEGITESCIMDKSKSNALAKTLVCMQALWFIAQCISRIGQVLPISLLELNTFGHCLCTLLIYVLWLHKPLDVNEPTVLLDRTAQQFLAWTLMRSRFEAYSVIVEAGNPIPGLRNPIPRDEVFSYQPTAQAYINGEWRTILPNEIVLFRQEELLNTGICYNPIYANGTLLAGPPDGGPFLMSSIDIERWILASSFLRIPNQAHINSSVKSDPPANWDGFEYDDNRILWVILIFVSWVYGGLHVLAWNAPFHSSVETILWRFSAIAIMAYAIMLGLLTLYLHTTLDLRRRYFQSKGKHKYYMVAKILTYSFENLWYVVRGGSPSDCGCLDFFMVILNLAYMFGRAYLVVECFLNLFHSDPGMFQQPQWSVYFPHLG